VQPTDREAEQELPASRSIRAAVRLCWDASPRLLVTVAVLAVVVAALPAAALLAVRALVDAYTGSGDERLAVTWTVVLGLLTAARGAVGALLAVRREELTGLVGITAEQRLLRVAGLVPLQRFDDPDWYDQVARAHDGVGWRPALVTGTLVDLAGQLVSLAGMGAVLAVLDLRLVGLAVLAGVPLLVQRRLQARAVYRARWATTDLERRRDYLGELLVRPDLAKDVRSYGLAEPFIGSHREISTTALSTVLAVHRRSLRHALLAALVGGGALVVAYVLAGREATGGALTSAELFLVFAAFTTLTATTADLFGVVVDLEEHAAYLTDYFLLLDGTPEAWREPEPAAGPPELAAAPRVAFDEVHYAYPDGPPVLAGVSFELAPGELVVLMGHNGAGKSTLVKVLLGLLEPDAGEVRMDGRPLAEVGADRLRRSIGVLYQEYGRYEFTVAESVRLGRADRPLDPARLADALRSTGLQPVVDALPRGVQNPVGRMFPGARDLSGGQWQRLALARVVYRDAPVWVLDEPTAALDIRSEADFLRRLRDERGGRTVLVVSHRLETARVADRVLVLGDGRVLENGPPDELLVRDGPFARLHGEHSARLAVRPR
jgi:ABC-type multidrug transport system fused ATPase/permease subunit